tara:strand:- start:3487 stop:3774 length:288 start_codon:yes stop_codon:yes gene_type:complete
MGSRTPRGPRGPKRPPMAGGFFGGALRGIANAEAAKIGKDKSPGAGIFGGGMRGGPAPIPERGNRSEGKRKFAEFLSMMQKSKGRRGGGRRRRRR